MGCIGINVWAGMAAMAAIACPTLAQAATVNLAFNGPGVAGALAISIMPDTNTGVLPTSLPAAPNSVDPIGSYFITGASGIFSDIGIGITNAAVTGIVGLNPVLPESTNLLAPKSFSLLPVASGVNEGGPTLSPGLHYDNLFYPGGSPLTATDYPFSGGLFDIYGLVFTLANGDAVDLWSNGVVPVSGLNYGIAVTDRINVLDYTGGVSLSAIPLPAAAPMFGVALLALCATGFGMNREANATA